MRTITLVSAILASSVAASVSAQQFSIKIATDNYFGVYSGSATAATTFHDSGSWPMVKSLGPFTPPSGNNFLYVVAWDDGGGLNGLLATVEAGAGLVATGSPLWTVCATNRVLTGGAAAVPTAASLTTAIVACNGSNSWHATSNGPNNDHAPQNGLWGMLPQIDGTANWIWDKNSTAACSGSNGFLNGACNPGEYLIFRLPLAEVARCPPPVPDFTLDWSTYGGLIADGSASQHELSHFWSIQESDPWWGSTGPEVTQWFSNQAGVFDLKAFFEGQGQKLKCDTYYRVKLAVSNRCINWRDSIRLVKLNCCPGEVICLDLNRTVITDTSHWRVTEVPASVDLPVAPFSVPGTPFGSPAPNWITAVSAANANGPGGFYTYEYNFCLCSGYSNPTLQFSLCTDNESVVTLNQTQIGTTGPNLVCATISAPASAFKAGSNVLKIRVRNRGISGDDNRFTPTGLSLNGTLSAARGQCQP